MVVTDQFFHFYWCSIGADLELVMWCPGRASLLQGKVLAFFFKNDNLMKNIFTCQWIILRCALLFTSVYRICHWLNTLVWCTCDFVPRENI